MNLIISEDQELRNLKEKNFFIGSWCINETDNFENNIENCLINKYHWSDKKKQKKDIEYLYSTHSFLLIEIGKALNNFYNQNYSFRYYQILLTKWLWRFILFYFDRWEIVKTLEKENIDFKCRAFSFKEEFFIPSNTLNYCTSIIYSNDWNHWVFSRIIKKISKVRLIEINEKKKIPNINQKKEKIEGLKKNINFLCSKISSKNLFAQNMTFSKKAKLLFNLYHKQFRIPYRETQNIVDTKEINLELRMEIFKEKNSRDQFTNFIFEEIPYNFPKVFFENYTDNKINLKTLNFPVKSKIIMTSMDHHFNDLFNLYTAEMVEKKSKLFIFQHGGSYGVCDDFTAEYLDIMVSDKFFTWGWKSNNKTFPFFAQKYFFTNEIKKINKRHGIVVPTTEFKKCPGDIAGGRPRYKDEVDLHIKDIILFIKNLNEKNRKRMSLKYLVTRNTNYVRKSISDAFPKLNLINSKKNTYMLNFKISIETLNSTGFLDAMYLNHPVILILNKAFSNLRQNAIKDFDVLKEFKIVHFDPLSAAKFLNNNYENLEEWWYDPGLQKVRKNFCHTYVRKSVKPFIDIKKIN